MEVKTIGVIGAGTMGRGNCLCSALGGLSHDLEDVMPEMLSNARAWIAQAFEEGAKQRQACSRKAAAALKRNFDGVFGEDACADLISDRSGAGKKWS